MWKLNVTHLNLSVMHGRGYLLMPKQHLYLLYRHTLIDRWGCKTRTELMREAASNITSSAQTFKHYLHSSCCQPCSRLPDRYEQCRIIISSGIKVLLKMNLGPSVKVSKYFCWNTSQHSSLSRLFRYSHSAAWFCCLSLSDSRSFYSPSCGIELKKQVSFICFLFADRFSFGL